VRGRWRPWSGALTVTLVTIALVVLDIGDGSVHRYWTRHSFTSSVVAGLLVLLLTLLIVDRVTHMRQVRSQSRAVGAQAAVILAQAARTADSAARAGKADGDSDKALDEAQTYTLMLLISTPVLIDTSVRRAFLEAAQRLDAEVFRALPNVGRTQPDEQTKTRLDDSLKRVRATADPLLRALNREQRAAVSPDEGDSTQA
jgi:hypothetical protein